MTLYKKEGRRYVPVHDTEAYNGLPNGCWMVKIEDGSTSVREAIQPNMAALKFAALIKSQKICAYLSKASEARPHQTKLTKKQLQIFRMFENLPTKDKLLYWQYDSLNDMAEKILDLILND